MLTKSEGKPSAARSHTRSQTTRARRAGTPSARMVTAAANLTDVSKEGVRAAQPESNTDPMVKRTTAIDHGRMRRSDRPDESRNLPHPAKSISDRINKTFKPMPSIKNQLRTSKHALRTTESSYSVTDRRDKTRCHRQCLPDNFNNQL